jgi:hypothetical protein
MTAVEWLVYELVFEENDNSSKHNKEVIKKAKEIEKQQKETDYRSGYLDCYTKLMSQKLTRN